MHFMQYKIAQATPSESESLCAQICSYNARPIPLKLGNGMKAKPCARTSSCSFTRVHTMNHVYRLVYNPTLNALVAVAECARGRSKSGASGIVGSVGALLAGVLLASGAAAAADVNALPSGFQLTAGAAAVSTLGSTLTVQQSSQRAAINWQSFNIGQGNTVNFVQPSASAVALNRVLGNDVSVIQGALNANGQVFLVNPNGVLFTPSAQVNVGSIVASTLAISTTDFIAGNYKFDSVSGTIGAGSAIINQGNITAAGDNGKGGSIALIAAKISNTGTLTANAGNVLLGAGNQVTLDLGGPVKLQVTQGAIDTLIENGGAIKADSGLVYLTAKAAGSLATSVINNSGVIEARSLAANAQGSIVLTSGHAVIQTGTLDASGVAGGHISINTTNLIDAGQTNVSGQVAGGQIDFNASGRVVQTTAARLQANGSDGSGGSIRISAGESAWLSGSLSATGQTGGDVSVTAPQLTLAETHIDASGTTAGGRIRVGGGWQGGDADLANAVQTRVVAAQFNVSATTQGNAGTAVVWSESDTLFGGTILARGGAAGGHGGQIEISSHGHLSFGGLVDASAAAGKGGQNGRLLLDPKNIDIVTGVIGLNVLNLADPTPAAGEGFGAGSFFSSPAIELMNGATAMNRIVVASSNDSTVASAAGAVYLYNSQTGALISTLTGSTANDNVGSSGITALSNGNFVVGSANWQSAGVTTVGAATWVNGSTGISGVVSSSNSLVGSTAGDSVGDRVTTLRNGNYVLSTGSWSNGSTANAGAATWGNGSTGTSGVVSSSNSLVGSTAGDYVGAYGITALSNGNYVVNSARWANGSIVNAGAVTWGNGSTGISGAVSSSNSLVGGTANGAVGSSGVVALTNGNYVVSSPDWGNGSIGNLGAATWADGSTGLSGLVSSSNSLVGSTAYDAVGSNNITALSNGNYVVSSEHWSNGNVQGVGAATWGDGSLGIRGVVSSSNSLIGSKSYDAVARNGVTALSNGNYVVNSYIWSIDSYNIEAGAVTWGNGSTGITGVVSSSNSLVGSRRGDQVGRNGVTALSNGNYVVGSSIWDNGSVVDAGAATWGNGSTGSTGVVSSSNSLVGSTANDQVGNRLIALSNGNYVVSSSYWTNAGIANAGAVTWGNGSSASAGISGVVSSSNSLVGSTANDALGQYGITSLNNGNYVVLSSNWDKGSVVDAGAVTWGDGSRGISGVVSSSNSLVGSTANDQVGSFGITALGNGNYVVVSSKWDSGSVVDAGAASWGNGSTGVSGVVSGSNSLLGSTASDQVGSGGAIALSDGRAVVLSPRWSRVTPSILASAGRVDILSFPSSASLPLGFNTDASANSSLSASTLLAQLNAGTNVTLQASNDITLSTAVTVNNPGGNGGALTLQAGRSIVLNANLSTDNGNLTLIANETAANGVVDAYRDAGVANITMAVGTSIDTGTGSVSIALKDGAGLSNNTAGAVTLASINAASLSVASNGFSASATAGNKTADGTTNATLSAANVGGFALQAGSNLSLVNPLTGSFADATVGTGKAVTSAAFGITGYNAALVSNLLKNGTALTANTNADISPGTAGTVKNLILDNAVQSAQQQTLSLTNTIGAGSTGNSLGSNLPSRAQSAGLNPIGSQRTSPMATDVSISGGLAFVPVADDAANAPETADLAAGFKRILVANGGINLTQLTKGLAR